MQISKHHITSPFDWLKETVALARANQNPGLQHARDLLQFKIPRFNCTLTTLHLVCKPPVFTLDFIALLLYTRFE